MNRLLRLILITLLFFLSTLSHFHSAHAQIPAIERAALIALYNSTDGDNWTNNSGWKDGYLHTDGFAMPGTEYLWYGVTWSTDGVLALSLYSNQLTGSIPSELGNLGNLVLLGLSHNQLAGSIPAALGNLVNLIYLGLDRNQLTGSIPAELGNLAKLQWLLLSLNELTGSIPAELGNLGNLIQLMLESNELAGNIPTELMNLSSLLYLDICDNHLYATDPDLRDFLDTLHQGWEDCQKAPYYIYYRDADGDGYGNPNDSLFADSQPEGYVLDNTDNCPETYNPEQDDLDHDGIGDACDICVDIDGDGICGVDDTCPYDPDNDADGDGICGDVNNCPCTHNPEQEDSDGDGCGDACDGRPDNPNWVSTYGSITYNGTSVCAMALANGQYMFTCGDNLGSYDIDVPLDGNGEITIQVFASFFSPFKGVLTPYQALCNDIVLTRVYAGELIMIVNFQTEQGTANPNWVRIWGTVTHNGQDVCAMVLANGQSMFSCPPDNFGIFDLEVPLDPNTGEITLEVFASGFFPYKATFLP